MAVGPPFSPWPASTGSARPRGATSKPSPRTWRASFPVLLVIGVVVGDVRQQALLGVEMWVVTQSGTVDPRPLDHPRCPDVNGNDT